MRVNPYLFGIAVLVIFLGTVFSAQAAGVWSVSGKATASGEKIQATGANPDEIKGWMTIGEVATAYKVDIKVMAKEFGFPEDTAPSKQLKDLESDKFSVTTLRDWLKNRQAP